MPCPGQPVAAFGIGEANRKVIAAWINAKLLKNEG